MPLAAALFLRLILHQIGGSGNKCATVLAVHKTVFGYFLAPDFLHG